MQTRYYLMNGTKQFASALKVPFDGKIKYDFEDISTLDLATMNIKKSEAKQYLEQYNTMINPNGMFYALGYPFSNDLRAFAPIFDYDKKGLTKYYNLLKKYAELRNYNVQHGNGLELDIENDRVLLEYLYDIYADIIDNNIAEEDSKKALLGEKSLLSEEAKLIALKRQKKIYNKISTQDYLYRQKNELIFLFSRYTELRKLILEYILYKAGIRCDAGNYIWPAKYYNHEGIYGYIPENKLVLSRQLELSEFMDCPEVGEDNKKRRH